MPKKYMPKIKVYMPNIKVYMPKIKVYKDRKNIPMTKNMPKI